MTEQDRGAYMPQSDAPLAFDARTPHVGRPMPMTLIASGGVLVLILGALFLAYRGGVRGAADTAAPLQVGKPVGAIKVAAAPDAQPRDPDANLDVYSAQNVPAVAPKPTFTAAPEQPQARAAPAAAAPVAHLQVNTVAPPPVRIEPPESVAPSTSRTTIHPGAADGKNAAAALAAHPAPVAPPPAAPVKLAAAKPTPLPAAAAKPPPVKAAPAKPAPVQAAASEVADAVPAPGAVAVQIGAFSSRELSAKGYADVSNLMAGRMGGHGSHVEPVERDGKTMFRTTVTGFADRAGAKTFCDALAAKGHSCFVKAG